MSYINRTVEPVILDMIQYFPVIVVTGPRQSGKSTLIRHLFGDFAQVSIEDIATREYALHDPIAFLQQGSAGMIIDEAQRAPELFSYIQTIVDNDRTKRFILSGSSNFAMMKSVSQSLAGRASVIDLLPMSMTEASEYASTLTLDELLYGGLYPAVCAGDNKPQYIYPAYARTYLERDVRELLQVKDMSSYFRFLKLCAGRIASQINVSQLASEVGVAVGTIKSWMSILEASYIITLLQPYYENTSKRLVKTPKIYFNDTGLACFLLDIETPQQLARDKMRGPLFENLIVAEAIKWRTNQGKAPNIYYYQDSNHNEIDIVFKSGDGMVGIEVKSAQTYHVSFEHNLRAMNRLMKPQPRARAVIYAGEMENTLGDIQLLNYRNIGRFLSAAM